MDKGKQYNKGKLKYNLISHIATKEKAKVYALDAHKYTLYKDDEGNIVKGADISFENAHKYEIYEDGSNNWRKGLIVSEVLDSLERHIQAYKAGEDYDDEMKTFHLANAAWNIDVLLEQYFTHPELDDRIKKRFKIALDIDGVLADFKTAYCKRHNIQSKNNHWHFTYLWKQEDGLFEDKDFWTNKIQPLVDGTNLSIEPVCYVTSRRCSVEWTKEWLEKHGFPCEPVYTNQASKVDVLKEMFERGEVDIFVDDAYKHFVELNNAGIPTYLFDRPYNRKYDVGYKKIYDLKELV
jgi:uncharacterized HAD superfamily protein